jgi:hypothetical protein
MKVLYLTDSEPDYLADQIYDGLCTVLGGENVFDFPRKAAYHGPDPRSSALLIDREGEEAQDALVERLRAGQLDLVLLSSPRRGVQSAFRTLADHVRLPPIVVLDGEDDAQLRLDLLRAVGAGMYFKREYRKRPAGQGRAWFRGLRSAHGEEFEGRIFPLPFSVSAAALSGAPSPTRDIDVSFVGRASHRKRLAAVRLLRDATDIRFEGGVYAEPTDRRSRLAESWFDIMAAKLVGDPPARGSMSRMGREAYRLLLGRSKTALSIRGGGFDTVRYWEIVAAKTPLISEAPDIDIPHNFEHGVHAVFCRPDLSDLTYWVRRLRDDEAERQRMAESAYSHVLAYHTTAHRASYLLKLCAQVL